jgi:hypothetical protein
VPDLVAIGGGFEAQDAATLLELGTALDFQLADGETIRDFLTGAVLKIRDKQGRLGPFLLNRAQREFANTCTKRNIVLKARQLGITTYIASRFFINTITRPGTVTVQVAHDQSSAEEIFRIVHRFLENLPEGLRKGTLETSRANVRQIVFPRLDAIANKNILDPNKFQSGLGKVIDGVVDCLNASAWAKAK